MIHTKSILIAILLFSSASFMNAQSTAKYEIELKKLEIRNDVNSPTFPDQVDRQGSQTTKKWTVLFARYIVKFDPKYKAPEGSLDNGKWLNSVSVNWEFLYKPEKAQNALKNYVRFGKEVTYANVEEGEHTALMFIDPKILKRFFNEGKTIKKDLYIKTSFKVNGNATPIKIGRTPFAAAYMSGGKLTKDWQKLDPFFADGRIKQLSNVVRSKKDTPFSVIQFDQFNTIATDDK